MKKVVKVEYYSSLTGVDMYKYTLECGHIDIRRKYSFRNIKNKELTRMKCYECEVILPVTIQNEAP